METIADKNSLWPAFLPEVESAINKALAALAAEEKALAELGTTETASAGPQLDRVRDRILGLRTCVDRPEQTAAEFDAVLQKSEEDVRSYLTEVEAIQQKLADWATRAIQ